MSLQGVEAVVATNAAAAARHGRARRLLEGAASGPPALVRRAGSAGAFPPTLPRASLDAAALRAAIDASGCARVPGLLPPEDVAALRRSIDRAFAAFDHHEGRSGTGDPWFDAYVPPGPSFVQGTRQWMRDGGGVFTADSPMVLEQWAGRLGALGVVDLVTEYFGEAPITSLDKCTLRRVGPGDGIDWHQDGAFLGIDSGALNLWVSLSDTATAPGLEILPQRLTEVVATGTEGARYGWTVSPRVVAELATDTPVEQPRFEPGDALFFDALLLHRTAQPPSAGPGTRCAIETWFFRPSRFPGHQEVPLAL